MPETFLNLGKTARDSVSMREPRMHAGATLPRLSKSRFMAGIQCLKRLYFQTFQRELAPPDVESTEAAFAAGHEVGKLARNRYPRGILIAEDLEWPDARSATQL